MTNQPSKLSNLGLRKAPGTLWCAAFLTLILPVSLQAQSQAPPMSDTTTIDPDGTARITRVIRVPRTVSPEAQAMLATGASWCPSPKDPAYKELIDRARKLYPVNIEEDRMVGGVRTKFLTPAGGVPASRKNRVLINLHGGGFTSDSGSYVESIPIASLTKTLVVSVDYRMAPSNHFPDATDDVIAVYKELLKTYKPSDIGIYGTSAGAALTAMTMVRIRKDGLPQPGALGYFSGSSDERNPTDTHSFFNAKGLVGTNMPEPGAQNRNYMLDHDPNDPLASPILADLKDFPATLCMSGTRDAALVGTANFNRALRRAGVVTELVVFDAMPHAFWYTTGIPESTEALEIQAKFLDSHLGQ